MNSSGKSIDNHEIVYTIAEFAEKSGLPYDQVRNGIGNWIPWENVRIKKASDKEIFKWKANKRIPDSYLGIAVIHQSIPNGETW